VQCSGARFGDDSRITRIAHHLALGTDENTGAEMIVEATSVDDLSGWLAPAPPTDLSTH